MNINTETLRSSWTIDGVRIFLTFDSEKQQYRIETRWYLIASFNNINDACDAFEAMEMIESNDHRAVGKWIKVEIDRVPRHKSAGNRSISELVSCVERRIAGLRPKSCGSKSSVTQWIQA